MNIKVHRGLDQIGGCITEIWTDTSRAFIDMGQNLPGVGEPTTEELDHEMVEKIFAQNRKEHEAVVYTHAHEDHVGLFYHVPKDIPQYIGEGGKELLLAKQKLLVKGHELNLRVCSGLARTLGKLIHKEAVARLDDEMAKRKEKISLLKSFHTWKRTKPQETPRSFEIGDIRITPFFNCHSIYDSYMFLIEADGKRIWHTGDYREHGYLGKGLFPTLKLYATNIDILITEGTMLNYPEDCIHEYEVSRQMKAKMEEYKYVFVLASSTDIERLAAVKEAAKKAHKDMYICSSFMKQTMELFTRRESKASNGLFEFQPKFVSYGSSRISKMKESGFVLVSGASQLAFVGSLKKSLDPSEVLLIYSSWDGYYKDPAQVALNPRYKDFRDAFTNVVDIHTSGHADRKTVEKVVETVNAKEVIIIHKEKDAHL